MKILYLSIYKEYLRYKVYGIANKIKAQINEFEKNGIVVVSKSPLGTNRSLLKQNLSAKKWSYISELQKYDAIYIRFDSANYDFVKLLRKYKKLRPDGKIVMEIPTYPFRKIYIRTFGRLYYIQSSFYLFWAHYFIDRIIIVSPPIKRLWNTRVLNIRNGIDYDKVNIRNRVCNSRSEIHIICVANFELWHGYDRLIIGLKQYLDHEHKENVILHMVGSGGEEKHLRELTIQYGLEQNVLFYGVLVGNQLDEVYDQCDIGAECFGTHRVNIKVSGSLKSREYGAKGLPIITASVLDVCNKETSKYICKFPSNEQPIDIAKIVSFYHQIYDGKNYEKTIGVIRETFKKYCSLEANFKEVINYLREE